MAVNTKEYYEGILKQAGVSDAKRQALIAALDDEEISKALANEQVVPRMRHDEYARGMDALKSESQKTADYYAQLTQWSATEQQKINDFWAQYGNNNGADRNASGQVVNGEYMTKKELEDLKKTFNDELARREQVQISLLKDVGRIASSHVHEFHEPLDTDALEKVAIEKKLTLRAAYDEMVAPRRAEAQSKSFAAQIAQARDEGAKEFASRHKIPVDAAPREYHVLLDRDPSKQVGVNDYVPNTGLKSPAMERQLRANFVEAWDGAQSSTSSGT